MAKYKTRRGELIAQLGARKIAAGHYLIANHDVKMIREASGSRPGLWTITRNDEIIKVPHLTEALERISEWITAETLVLASALTSETVPADVELVDETTEPVVQEVAPEPVVETVQEDVAPIVTPAKKVKSKAKTYRTRRAELLATLEAREVATAEYHVAGHHVEYVAPGVMPRNAGGRWRTTLLSDQGVVVSWNLSLTAALEVVAARVAETADETEIESSGARRYVAVYPSAHRDADLCELHTPGCADLSRTGKRSDPQVAVVLDITDEDATMRTLDPDQLGYDVHAVKVMSCAQHAPVIENTDA